MNIEVRLALVGLVTTALLTALRWTIARARPILRDDTAATISPDKVSALFTVMIGTFIFLGGCAAFVLEEGEWGPRLLAILGATIAWMMAPSLTSVHDVSWTPLGIQGPCRMFGPTLGTRRTEIAWADIERFGTTITGFWYVESRDGRRVYWSYLYRGQPMLAAALRANCPSLILPRARPQASS